MVLRQEGKKLVVIMSGGPIAALGGINGPITTPTWISTTDVIRLINSGSVVYEVNPADPSKKVKLTRLNVSMKNFSGTKVIKTDKIETDSSKKLAERVEKGQINGLSITATTSPVTSSDFN